MIFLLLVSSVVSSPIAWSYVLELSYDYESSLIHPKPKQNSNIPKAKQKNNKACVSMLSRSNI